MTHPEKPSILFVMPDLNPGGAQMILTVLMTELSSTHFKKSAVVLTGEKSFDITIPCNYFRKKTTKSSLLALLKYIRKHKPDLVMTTMSHANFALLLLKPFLPRSTKIIIREASMPSAVIQHSAIKWLNTLLYRHLYPTADCIISPAQIIIDEFQNKFGHKKATHYRLYNPVPVEKIHKKAEGECAIMPSGVPNFVCVGRIHKAKGYDRLLKNLKKIVAEKNCHITILGGGSTQEFTHLKTIISQQNLEKHVHLGGHCDNPYPTIKNADALLLPSRWEGLPNVVLEALCLGTPVIASAQAGGIHEIKNALNDPSMLSIASDMDEFSEYMMNAKKQNAKTKKCHVPEIFQTDFCIQHFSLILKNLLLLK